MAGAEVETLMGSDPPLYREAWHRIKGWYNAAVYRAPPPSWVTIKPITAEWVEQYSYILPPETNIPISVRLLVVDNSVPTEDKIEWAVKRLRNHRSGGPSGMQTNCMKRWLAAAKKAEKDVTITAGAETTENKGIMAFQKAMEPTEAPKWAMVVDLVHTELWEGKLAEEAMWQAVVLILKGKKDYWVIGLM